MKLELFTTDGPGDERAQFGGHIGESCQEPHAENRKT